VASRPLAEDRIAIQVWRREGAVIGVDLVIRRHLARNVRTAAKYSNAATDHRPDLAATIDHPAGSTRAWPASRECGTNRSWVSRTRRRVSLESGRQARCARTCISDPGYLPPALRLATSNRPVDGRR